MNIIKVILLFIVLITIRCAMPVKGGGGETTNGCVLIGALVFEDGTPAVNVKVMLIPEHYNPAEDGILADSIIDTTDANGKYAITSPAQGNFNIQAVDITTRNRALIRKIEIKGDSMMLIPDGTITEPGRLNIVVSEQLPISSGYIYIKGTTYYLTVNRAKDTLVFDSLPTGIIPEIRYVQNGGESNLIVSNAYVALNGFSTVTSGVVKTLFTSIDNNRRFDYVTSCQLDGEGNIWVGTDSGGLYKLNETAVWKRFEFSGTIRCHKIDLRGLHWIGTNKGLFTFDGRLFYPSIINSADTIHDNIMSIFVDSENKKWIITPTGIFCGESGSWQSVKYPVTGYTDLLIDNSGTVWIATMAEGILADYGSGRKTYTVENPMMPTNSVNFLTLDSDGAIWAGTMNGIVKINGSDMYNFKQSKNGVDFTDITHGVVTSSGELWYSGNAMYLCNLQSKISYEPTVLWGKHVRIESIAVDSRGVVWAGSYGGGLVRIEHGTD